MFTSEETNKLRIFFVQRTVHKKSGLCKAQAAQELQFDTECGAMKVMSIDLTIGCFFII